MKYIFMAVFLLLLAGCFQNKAHYSYNKERYYMPSYLSTDTKKIYKLMEVKPITTATIIKT